MRGRAYSLIGGTQFDTNHDDDDNGLENPLMANTSIDHVPYYYSFGYGLIDGVGCRRESIKRC